MGEGRTRDFSFLCEPQAFPSTPLASFPPICLSSRGCTHTSEANEPLALSPGLSRPMSEGGRGEMSLWDAGEESCGHSRLPARTGAETNE